MAEYEKRKFEREWTIRKIKTVCWNFSGLAKYSKCPGSHHMRSTRCASFDRAQVQRIDQFNASGVERFDARFEEHQCAAVGAEPHDAAEKRRDADCEKGRMVLNNSQKKGENETRPDNDGDLGDEHRLPALRRPLLKAIDFSLNVADQIGGKAMRRRRVRHVYADPGER